MTNLGALLDWLGAGKALRRNPARRNQVECEIRALPREEICVWTKNLSNVAVVRVVDRRDWLAGAGTALSVIICSVLLIALLLPSAYARLADHRIAKLQDEHQALRNELNILRVRSHSQQSPQQLDEWAGDRFHNPTAAAVVFAPPSRGTVAALGKR